MNIGVAVYENLEGDLRGSRICAGSFPLSVCQRAFEEMLKKREAERLTVVTITADSLTIIGCDYPRHGIQRERQLSQWHDGYVTVFSRSEYPKLDRFDTLRLEILASTVFYPELITDSELQQLAG